MWKIPEEHRLNRPGFGIKGDPFGAFKCDSPTRKLHELIIMASPGGTFEDGGKQRTVKWEHVSVHASANFTGTWVNTTPTWDEMDYVKGLFWDPADVVMQLHVNDGKKIDIHKFTLHLWRPTDKDIPLPDPDLV